jgi:hypothetical protein
MIKVIIGILAYLAIEDCIYLGVNLFSLIILHIAIFIHNPFFIFILPFYFLMNKIDNLYDWTTSRLESQCRDYDRHNQFFNLLFPLCNFLHTINSIIGLADWIGIAFGIYYTKDVFIFMLIMCITSICFIQEGKKCPMYPGIFIGLLTAI